MIEMENGIEDVMEMDPKCRYVHNGEILGRGSSKVVYRAFDREQGSEVAWNQISVGADAYSSKVDHLQSEIYLLRTLQHPNIIRCNSVWVDQNLNVNFITELFCSGTLSDYYKLHGKHVKINTVKSWVRQILCGLEYLHTRKPPIIHRDIKCDNIFINGNTGEVKIGDMGFATEMSGASLDKILGTPEYMAPEILDQDYNQLVDVYALGMSVLEMITREYPYMECDNMLQIFMKVKAGEYPESLQKISDPQARAFIMRCLAPASKRPPARELRWDPFLASSTVYPDSPTTPTTYRFFGSAESSISAEFSSDFSSCTG